MIVYPAIDIRGGRCVRQSQGRDDARTNYYEDPVEPAVQFAQAGAEWIHVVDLDGALGVSGDDEPVFEDDMEFDQAHGN